MDSKDGIVLFIIIVVCVALGIVLGVIVGAKLQTEHCKKVSIQHGIAQYHPQTGEFEWLKEGR